MMARGRYLSRLIRTFYPGADIHDGEGEIFVTFDQFKKTLHHVDVETRLSMPF